MKTALFDYDLPRELIAQHPAERRDASRLLVLDRATGRMEHRRFADIAGYVGPGDALVLNNTRVIRARLMGTRATGGAVEVLLVRRAGQGSAADAGGIWEALVQCRGHLKDGEVIRIGEGLSAKLLGRNAEGVTLVDLECGRPVDAVLDEIGRAPLPPYIKRPRQGDSFAAEDSERYQTVYAKVPGAVAAPTAGLHFTRELLSEIERKGVRVAAVTLHVGPGTFKPVVADEVEGHRVDPEFYAVCPEAAEVVRTAARVVAVGTTMCWVLETLAREGRDRIEGGAGRTGLFIYPPFEFHAVDALVTNFHLPKSSLLMLVSAFATREMILAAYEEAKREKYRFYSYGDAMLIV